MFSNMINAFKMLFKEKASGTSAVIDMTQHATKFSQAVDDYVKSLMDPAKRPLLTTSAPLIIPPIVTLASTPAGKNKTVNALKSATQYATGISLYTAALVVDPSPVFLMKGGILTPPGKVTVAKLTDLGVLASIKDDFKEIFLQETAGLEEEIVVLLKATNMANAIKKAFTTKTSITISGLDSTLPPPAGIGPQPFSIIGPLS